MQQFCIGINSPDAAVNAGAGPSTRSATAVERRALPYRMGRYFPHRGALASICAAPSTMPALSSAQPSGRR